MNGVEIFASYSKQPIAEYAGNPLIEALPPILTDEAAMGLIANLPYEATAEELALERSVRIHCIDRLRSVVQPMLIHLELESMFSLLIRRGYVGRNPTSPTTVRHLHSLSGAQRYHDGFKSTAETFSLVGLSGIGKSTALCAILSLYPQTIKHERFEGKQFVHTQITWLKLDCPRDGSLAGFCQEFFIAVGKAMGDEHYHKRFRARNINDSLQQMAQVASTFFIGALLIDEIQNLHFAKTGGKDNMLNFFLHLVNNIGIPVVFIGTNSMVSLFSDVLRNARRCCGVGIVEFKRFEKQDDEWKMLVENLWSYQWCQQRAELTDDIYDALYEHTQGVTDFLVKLLVLTQRYAIQSGEERITAASIRLVSDSKMQILNPALAALRSQDPKRMSQFEDLLPIGDQLANMMAFDFVMRQSRLELLRSAKKPEPVSDGSDAKAPRQASTALPIAVVSTAKSQAAAISNSGDSLAALREAGWLNQDLFEFSSLYRK
ncbi:Transposon Tn7 transposition protein TnsC [Pseudomonas fluorescens]|nr:Transposon Tn7 transposition protein TnsC [Pseudomonas fluorescens]